MNEERPHLQQRCRVCGSPTDLPALWRCPCGAWATCYRSPCCLAVPVEHRDGRCVGADPQEAGE